MTQTIPAEIGDLVGNVQELDDRVALCDSHATKRSPATAARPPAANRQRDAQPTSDRPAPKRKTPVVGKRTEPARYTVAEGEPIVYAQRVGGVVRVTDRPATPGGRAYLVERGPQTKDELDALVRDVAEAERTGAQPLASCPVDRYLDAVA